MDTISTYIAAYDHEAQMKMWLDLYTGYDIYKERPEGELEGIKEAFEQFRKTHMHYKPFAEHYKWHYVMLRQLGSMTYEECERNCKILDIIEKTYIAKETGEQGEMPTKTFFEWVSYINSVTVSERDVYESADFYRVQIEPNLGMYSNKVTYTKNELRDLIEKAYQAGKKNL